MTTKPTGKMRKQQRGVYIHHETLAKLLIAAAEGLRKHDSSIVISKATARAFITFFKFAVLTHPDPLVKDWVTYETASLGMTLRD